MWAAWSEDLKGVLGGAKTCQEAVGVECADLGSGEAGSFLHNTLGNVESKQGTKAF